MRSSFLLVLLVGLFHGCDGGDGPTLLVELKTDLVSGVEIAAVRTQLFDAAARSDELTRRQVDVAVGRDLTIGHRVAELPLLAPGEYLLTVTLVDLAGGAALSRDVVVSVSGNTAVTVLMTRNCVGVMCPATGTSPMESACLAGRCVEERCTPETPERCPPPECATPLDCTAAISSCAEWVCESGVCLTRTATGTCGADAYCDPAAGCMTAPVTPDAGPADAGDGGGPLDAGDAMVGLPSWAEEAYIKASNTGAVDQFGDSLSLSADGGTLAVASPKEDSAATGVDGDERDNSALEAGAVYIFVRDGGGAWVQEAYLKASNTGAGDFFGESVSLSSDGNTLAVGARAEDSAATGLDGDGGDNSAALSGAVYVFSRRAGGWAQQAYLKASNTGRRHFFGESVSLSADGDTLAVGAWGETSAATGVGGDESDTSAFEVGAVYVFSRSSGVWRQEAYLKASNAEARDRFGWRVTLSAAGDTLAVGAHYEGSATRGVNGIESSNLAPLAGAVYVFSRSAAVWSQTAYLKASNTGAGDYFGAALSLSGDGATLAVGADHEASAATGIDGDQGSDTAAGAGAVYVFSWSGGRWAQSTYLKASNTGANDAFGESLSLSADGSVLAVCARGEASAATGVDGDESDNSAFEAGAVYVFAETSGGWVQRAYLKASNSAEQEAFGEAMSLAADGRSLALGARLEDSAATGVDGDGNDDTALWAGAAYVFRLGAP